MDTTEGSEAPPPTLPQDEPPSMEEATAVASTSPPPPDPPSCEDRGEEKGEVTVSRLLFCWISRHLQSCCLSRSKGVDRSGSYVLMLTLKWASSK